MVDNDTAPHFATQAVSGGAHPHQRAAGDIVSPIHVATTFVHDEMRRSDTAYSYTRSGNPTRTALEERLAALENGDHALALSAGMGAIGTTVMSLLEPGDHVVAFNYLYGGTRKLFDELYTDTFDVTVEYIDATSTEAVEDAITEQTKLVWVESPTNPLMKLCDISAIADITADSEAIFCVDNTFATPYFQHPLELGADVVVHSTTKYINGHSDSLGGTIITRNDEIAEAATFVQKYGTVSVLSPFDAYLTLRGITTLPARMDRHADNAMAVAEFLEEHTGVTNVYYPGLANHPQHDLANTQMRGYGGMLSFEIAGGEPEAAVVLEALRQIRLAVSLGGVESLIAHVPTMTHYYLDEEIKTQMGISDSLIRLSVGIEHPEDIIADLAQALARL